MKLKSAAELVEADNCLHISALKTVTTRLDLYCPVCRANRPQLGVRSRLSIHSGKTTRIISSGENPGDVGALVQ